jgi:hypothetical protein
MSDLLLQNILDQVTEGRADVKALDKKLDTFVKETEHRMTKVETRAALFSIIISSVASFFGFKLHS